VHFLSYVHPFQLASYGWSFSVANAYLNASSWVAGLTTCTLYARLARNLYWPPYSTSYALISRIHNLKAKTMHVNSFLWPILLSHNHEVAACRVYFILRWVLSIGCQLDWRTIVILLAGIGQIKLIPTRLSELACSRPLDAYARSDDVQFQAGTAVRLGSFNVLPVVNLIHFILLQEWNTLCVLMVSRGLKLLI